MEAAATPGLNPLQIALVMLALFAFAFAVWSALRAWGMSLGSPGFNQLGWKKWVMGTAVIAYMPASAMPHVKAYFGGFAVFILAIVGLAATVAFNPSAVP